MACGASRNRIVSAIIFVYMEEEHIEEMQPSAKSKYEEKKAQKDAAKNQNKKSTTQGKNIKQFAIYGIIGAVVIGGGIGIYLLVQSNAPKGEDYSVRIPIQEGGHIDVGRIHQPYASDPPSSGSHYRNTARVRFYDEEAREENIVHNLEHGDIWIAYHPRISQVAKDQLKNIQGTKIIVTPRDANEFDISLVAWGRIDSFNIDGDTLDEFRVKDFIKRYINKGPEKVSPSIHGGV